MNMPDSDRLSEDVIAAMRAVSNDIILPRFKKLATNEVRSKSEDRMDVVTVADEESERYLANILPLLWPGSRVLGEEAAAADSGVLDCLTCEDPVWIIDPIDGTANFVKGNTNFAVMIALVRNQKTLMGWIHSPLSDRTILAQKGGGCWQVEQTQKFARRQFIPIQTDRRLSSLVASMHHKELKASKEVFGRLSYIGSAAHDYWALAEGRLHVVCYNQLKPWDHAAGVLIHAEAQGYNKLLTGQPYRPLPDETGILCAPDEVVWDAVAAHWKPAAH